MDKQPHKLGPSRIQRGAVDVWAASAQKSSHQVVGRDKYLAPHLSFNSKRWLLWSLLVFLGCLATAKGCQRVGCDARSVLRLAVVALWQFSFGTAQSSQKLDAIYIASHACQQTYKFKRISKLRKSTIPGLEAEVVAAVALWICWLFGHRPQLQAAWTPSMCISIHKFRQDA